MFKVKFPYWSVIVPILVPLIMTEAPGRGDPLESTLPSKLSTWEYDILIKTKKKHTIRNTKKSFILQNY